MSLRVVLAALCMIGLTTTAVVAQSSEPQYKRLFQQLRWSDLLPPGEAERLARLTMLQELQLRGFDHSGFERLPQIQTFEVVEALDNAHVRIGGYVLPFDYSTTGEVNRFLLVPYVGACVHTPPPPPNQLVYVTSEDPILIEELWAPVQVEGYMRLQRSDNELGDTAYTLELIRMTRIEL